MPEAALHYDLTCLWLREVDAWAGGGSHPADTAQPMSAQVGDAAGAAAAQRRLYSDFFASCGCPKRCLLEPFPALESQQCRSDRFVPHQCLRQLALIENTEFRLH